MLIRWLRASKHISRDWILSDVIEEIIVSPYADVDYEDWGGAQSRQQIRALPIADRVVLSELHERIYPPGF